MKCSICGSSDPHWILFVDELNKWLCSDCLFSVRMTVETVNHAKKTLSPSSNDTRTEWEYS